jgi:hypothetical protein
MTILATRKPVRARRKPARTVRLGLAPFGPNPGILDITEGEALTSYFLYPLASDFGLAYRLEKFGVHQRGDDDAVYHVCLELDAATCDCKGHTYAGHCRHVEALQALQAKGELPLPPVANAPAEPAGWPRCSWCNHRNPAACGCNNDHDTAA